MKGRQEESVEKSMTIAVDLAKKWDRFIFRMMIGMTLDK